MAENFLKIIGTMKIFVVNGDITLENTDAIVNAGHEMLLGGGGVDGAIHRAAGPKLLQECRRIEPNQHGVRCDVGEAHVTYAWNLPCKYVIHTVAPKFVGGIVRHRDENGIVLPASVKDYRNRHPETEQQMADCYINSMRIADKMCLQSIAFPSLGTGGHAYPIELACPIAIRSVISQEWNYVGLVKFVCFGEYDYNKYVDILDKGLYEN